MNLRRNTLWSLAGAGVPLLAARMAATAAAGVIGVRSRAGGSGGGVVGRAPAGTVGKATAGTFTVVAPGGNTLS